jgi:cell wall-associated NlpC family hydrolase
MWSDGFLNLPYLETGRTRAGVDCWGIVRIVYGEALGIDLPSFDGRYVDLKEREEIERLFNEALEDWVDVPRGQERQFDVLRFQVGRYRTHVGIVVEPRRDMLHAVHGEPSALAIYRDPPWAPRLIGAQRHREMLERYPCEPIPSASAC